MFLHKEEGPHSRGGREPLERLSSCIFLILFLLAAPGVCEAKVTGQCVNCHTMHNSQGGNEMAYSLSSSGPPWSLPDDTTPNPTLLISDCVGCHTSAGTDTTHDGVPIVLNIGPSDPTQPLAGGNFRYCTTGDANIHNVAAIDEEGTEAMFPPPGDQASTGITASNFSCAGTYGCHGDRSEDVELDAIKTAHHTDDSCLKLATYDDSEAGAGSDVGKSYRFLDGVRGVEDDDWEQNDGNSTHNWYQGPAPPNKLDSGTTSYLCGQCHGNSGVGGFHSPQGVGYPGPWLRHPTDILIPTEGEFAGLTSYDLVVPVGYTDPSNPDRGYASVICLSCHRAHGSPNFKLMRWDYKGWPASGENGCAVCHTWKD